MTLAAILAAGLLLGAAEADWIEDIRSRAEADARAEAAGAPSLTLTEEDPRLIKRKVEFGVVRATTGLVNLRDHIRLRLAEARAAGSMVSYRACFEEPTVGVDGENLPLLALPERLAREQDPDLRRLAALRGGHRLWQLLPVLQYAYLDESREIGWARGRTTAGFQPRDEDLVRQLADGARRILNETEPAFQWLRTEVGREELGMEPEAITLADLPALLHDPFAEALTEESLDASLAGLTNRLASQLPPGTLLVDRSAPSLWPRIVPIDPPRQVSLALPTGGGIGPLQAVGYGTGVALTYALARDGAPFEHRWLAQPAVRESYGYLLRDLATDPNGMAPTQGLPEELAPRFRRAVALARVTWARVLAAQVLFEEAQTRPGANALGSFTVLHSRALALQVPPEAAPLFVEALRSGAPRHLQAMQVAARIDRALSTSYGDDWTKSEQAVRKVVDGLRQVGYEDLDDVRNRFRAQRDDARTLLASLLDEAAGAGFPGARTDD